MTAFGVTLVVLGAVLLLIAAWGVVALPDALSRQHAATKAVTLAVALVCLGASLTAAQMGWTWRLLLIMGFLLATLPVASHLLARAALRESGLQAQAELAPQVGDVPSSLGADPTVTRRQG